jgi:hypothetical protein
MFPLMGVMQNYIRKPQDVFFLTQPINTSLHSSELSLDFLKIIIIVIVCLAPVIEC